jgi:hypothetical protein
MGERAHIDDWGSDMTKDEVCGFLALMDNLRVEVWLDGGWAVDTCLGYQTRHHDDLDIVIEERYVSTAVSALKHAGYAPVPRPDTRACNFVLGDKAGPRGSCGRRSCRQSSSEVHHARVVGPLPRRLRAGRE